MQTIKKFWRAFGIADPNELCLVNFGGCFLFPICFSYPKKWQQNRKIVLLDQFHTVRYTFSLSLPKIMI